MAVSQATVDQLVEKFYENLTKEQYFVEMFAERNVDIDKLKERQRIFIARLINENDATSEKEQKEQVQNRHTFSTTPERAKLWLDTMARSMDEIGMSPEVKEPLLTKIKELVGVMIK
ncbi:protoglobin domain-containing protein [Bacillaceae bacterium W0354]